MINVSRILNNPKFKQPFTVNRSTGNFVNGTWTENAPTVINMTGAVTTADAKTIDQVEEGDRVTGAMLFYSNQQILETHTDPAPGTSDQIVWNGDTYRVIKVWDYSAYGFYKAYAGRMSGA